MINSSFNSILDSKPVSDFVGRCVGNYLTKLGEDGTCVDDFPSNYTTDVLSDSEKNMIKFTLFESLKFGSIPSSVEEFVDLLCKTSVKSVGEQIVGVYPIDTITATESTHQLIAVSMPNSIGRANKYGIIFQPSKDQGVSLSVINLAHNIEAGIYDTCSQWDYNIVEDKESHTYNVIPTHFERIISTDGQEVTTTIEYTTEQLVHKYNVSEVVAGEHLNHKNSISMICYSPKLIACKEAREDFERIFSIYLENFAYTILNEFITMSKDYGILDKHHELEIATFHTFSQTPASFVRYIDNSIREVEFDADDGHWNMDICDTGDYESDNKDIALSFRPAGDTDEEYVEIKDTEILNKHLKKNFKKSLEKIAELAEKYERYKKAYFG